MTEMKTKNLVIKDVTSLKSGSAPIGTIVFFTNTATMLSNLQVKNWLVANGASLKKATYPDLFTVIGYIYGGSGDNFNLPKLTDARYIRGGTSITTAIAASLPNIKGHAGWFNVWRSWNTANLGGAFYNTTIRGRSGEEHAGSDHERDLQFDASKSNSIYSGSTVTPLSIQLVPLIRAW